MALTAVESVRWLGFKTVSTTWRTSLPGDLLVEQSGGHVGFGVAA